MTVGYKALHIKMHESLRNVAGGMKVMLFPCTHQPDDHVDKIPTDSAAKASWS